ncbi:MAG: hypothetical protein HYW80_01290, partial [Parcubacteria group bacterium]|nr:hypothetical protein [Parcubacteria group bacterium]
MKAKSLVALEGAALLVGTIFGAGFLVLPYTALRGGVWLSLLWLIFFGGVATLLHLMYGEVVLASDDDHRLPGYARLYLGRLGQTLATTTFVVGVFGGLLVYLLLGSTLFQETFSFEDGFSPVLTTVVFWAAMTVFILAGIKLSSGVNFLLTTVTMAILLGLSIFSLASFLDVSNFSLPRSASPLFPYGIILFSVIGYLAIPEITSFLGGKTSSRA